jgi:hypothetical protein
MASPKQKIGGQALGLARLDLQLKNVKKLTQDQAVALVKASHWCRVFNGDKEKFGPDLSGLEEISPIVAREIAKFCALDLDGLRELTPASAAELSKNGSYISLGKIKSLTPATASALAKNCGSLFLDGIKTISVPVAAALAKHGKKHIKLSLGGVNELSVEAARLLAHRPGCLIIGLNKMNPTLAKALSAPNRRSCCLQMGSFKSLDLESARILAESKGTLSLNVSRITPELIEVFKKNKGDVFITHLRDKNHTVYHFYNNKVKLIK